MITYCAAIILLLTCPGLQAQTFAPLGTVWTYERDAFWRPGYREAVHLVVADVKMFRGEVSSFLDNGQILTERPDGIYFFSEHTDQFELLFPHSAQANDTFAIVGISSDPPPMERCVIRVLNTYKDTLCDGRIIDLWDTELIPDPITGHNYWEIFGRISPQIGPVDHYMFPQPGLAAPHITGLRCIDQDSFFCNFTDHNCDALISSVDQFSELDISIKTISDRLISMYNLPDYGKLSVRVIATEGRIIWESVEHLPQAEIRIELPTSGAYFIHVATEGHLPHVKKVIVP